MYVLAEFMGIPRLLMKEWIQEIDADGDGQIQYSEFHKYLRDTDQSYKNNKSLPEETKVNSSLMEDLIDCNNNNNIDDEELSN